MKRILALVICLILVTCLPAYSNASFHQKLEKTQENNIEHNNRRIKVRLRKNKVNGVNTLTQEMIKQANRIYIIKHNYVIGDDIIMPDNCVLKFNGGSLTDGKVKGNRTIIENVRKGIFRNVSLEGDFIGEVRSSWFNNDDDITFSSMVLFDKAIVESDLHLDGQNTPTTHKSLCLQGINHPTIYTNFDDDEIAGNGVNTLRISTPMGVKEVELTIKDLNIIDTRYNPAVPLVKSMSSGVFVFPHDPNTDMTIKLENLFVKTRGDSFGFSHEQENGYTYDGTFNLYVNKCSIESGEFCVETYKPGDVKEMFFINSHFVSTHIFRPELSLGTHAVEGQKRDAHIYVKNCTFDKGMEHGIHEYAANPNTNYVVTLDNCVFNRYQYVNEYNVHRAGEGIEVIANNCIFKNDSNSLGGASGGEKLEFNDCIFQLSYKGDAYGLFAAKNNLFKRCTFDCNRMMRFYGNHRDGKPLLFKAIIFDNCVFINTDIVISRYAESISVGMNYQVKDCQFEGNSSIRHWDTTDYNKARKFFNTNR